jgi:hypothetical protein
MALCPVGGGAKTLTIGNARASFAVAAHYTALQQVMAL